ncbi:hypothetical protein JZ751_023379 [Albula glossodonta]|uniref:Solute carrier family 41 member n=1 Tax=Albula glossodonta TaxID=121402 RepID=A0A8T2NQ51_9TELE|nr:hypothetical protein JZ751_023379 [Albula glossodonta]
MSSNSLETKTQCDLLESHYSNGSVHLITLDSGAEQQLTTEDHEQTESTYFLDRTDLHRDRSELIFIDPRANTKGDREDDSLLENSCEGNDSEDTVGHQIVIETTFSIGLQVVFPFLLAGFGTVAAGMVLDIVQHWTVFKDVTEVFILVPALLGLKGNLEMTLASRLSTAVSVRTGTLV